MLLPLPRMAFSVLLCISPALAAAGGSPESSLPGPVQALIERYSTDHDLIENVYTDSLAPVTRERRSRFIAEWRKQLAAVPFESLDQEGKADYLLLANHLTREEHALALAASQWKQVEPLLPVAADIFALEDARRAIEIPNGEKTAEQLNAMTARIAAKRRELEARSPAARPSRVDAWRAADDLDELHEQLRNWFKFYHGYDPAFSWWVDGPTRNWTPRLRTTPHFCAKSWPVSHPATKPPSSGLPLAVRRCWTSLPMR